MYDLFDGGIQKLGNIIVVFVMDFGGEFFFQFGYFGFDFVNYIVIVVFQCLFEYNGGGRFIVQVGVDVKKFIVQFYFGNIFKFNLFVFFCIFDDNFFVLFRCIVLFGVGENIFQGLCSFFGVFVQMARLCNKVLFFYSFQYFFC